MRVNIYAEELREPTDKHGERVVLRKKRVVPGFNHFGIQILLGDRVIHAEHGKQKDDDTPAVTFWFASEYEKTMLVEILESALEKVRETQISELAP